jgi:hypothetical protein
VNKQAPNLTGFIVNKKLCLLTGLTTTVVCFLTYLIGLIRTLNVSTFLV